MSETNVFHVKYRCFGCYVSLSLRTFKVYSAKHQPLQPYVQLKASRKLGWNEMDVELLSKSEPWRFPPTS